MVLVRFAALVVAAALPGTSAAQDYLVHPDPSAGWYFGARAVAGASHEDTGFSVLPPGSIGETEASYNPQENFGTGAMIGYGTSAWGVPVRAELSGTWMYRHDADMRALFGGGAFVNYQNNLMIWDVRLSVLADILQFGWGSFYAGAGLGAALLQSEVTNSAGVTVDNDDWKISPSAQAGIRIDDVFRGIDLDFSYRFRWFGDTESGVFPTGERLNYDNAHIHEFMVGVIVPLGR